MACDIGDCVMEFKDYMVFKSHKRDHEKKTKETTLSCPEDGCEETFAKWSDLVNHKKISHPLGTQCSTCGKTFTHRNLKVHLPIHQEKRPTLQCTFDGCPRFYFHQKNLNHHIKVKHEGKGFNCTICDRKLSTKQKLTQHIDIIHNRNPNTPKKKKKANLLKKVAVMTEDDWKLKKTGPARFVRQGYDWIKFPNEQRNSSQPMEVQSCSKVTEVSDGVNLSTTAKLYPNANALTTSSSNNNKESFSNLCPELLKCKNGNSIEQEVRIGTPSLSLVKV